MYLLCSSFAILQKISAVKNIMVIKITSLISKVKYKTLQSYIFDFADANIRLGEIKQREEALLM